MIMLGDDKAEHVNTIGNEELRDIGDTMCSKLLLVNMMFTLGVYSVWTKEHLI